MSDLLDQISSYFVDVAPRFALIIVRAQNVDYEIARDALHDAFRAIASRVFAGDLSELADRTRFEKFLYRAASNAAIDVRRRSHRFEKNERTLLLAIDDRQEGAMVTAADTERLHIAIEKLRLPYREIFRRLIYREETLAEIAAALGIPPGSIYKRYSRGVEALRKLLGL
ncbi:MAG TPA: sigma-70 family RNA polymerase sigma factor [Thermoanaerobaculia bacterium]|nr:sigma-70 family RNA polymerase sigma factor [Thermoanaerobaculia bacterium]